MPFLRSFSVDTDKRNPFPFNIPAVKFAKKITLDPKVTIFVGDNGCGKSTDHYRITKTFLDNPEFYLRHLR